MDGYENTSNYYKMQPSVIGNGRTRVATSDFRNIQVRMTFFSLFLPPLFLECSTILVLLDAEQWNSIGLHFSF